MITDITLYFSCFNDTIAMPGIVQYLNISIEDRGNLEYPESLTIGE